MRLWVALTVAACGSKPPPAAQPIPTPPAPPTPPACVTPPDDVAQIAHATVDGSRVAYCVGTDQCFALDLATGKLERLATTPNPDPARGARATVAGPEIQVCNGDSCTSFKPPVLPSTSPLQATTNADGSFAVLLVGGRAEIWDAHQGTRTATINYARDDFRCGEVAMLGETIYVSASTCDGPAARATLYTLKGRKIANVGGRDFGSYGNARAHVAGTTWAFLDENGNHLVLQDVVTGKIVKTIDTSGLWTLDGSTSKDVMGNPGEHALLKLADDKLAVIAGAPANGSVAVVETESGDVKVIHAPLCTSS